MTDSEDKEVQDERVQENENEHEAQELFPSKERHRIVRRFIEAFMSGTVKLDFLTAQEIEEQPRSFEAVKKLVPGFAGMGPVEVAMRSKATMLETISIAAGARKSASEEREIAIDSVFQFILSLRALGKIEGEFLPTSRLESRLADLEDKATRQEELLRELEILIRNLGGSGLP